MPIMNEEMLHDFMDEHFPQVSDLDMRVEAVDERTIRMRLPVDDRHLRPGGTVSGPTLMTLADCAMYLLVLAQIGPVAAHRRAHPWSCKGRSQLGCSTCTRSASYLPTWLAFWPSFPLWSRSDCSA